MAISVPAAVAWGGAGQESAMSMKDPSQICSECKFLFPRLLEGSFVIIVSLWKNSKMLEKTNQYNYQNIAWEHVLTLSEYR
jgi:hypothetical protein